MTEGDETVPCVKKEKIRETNEGKGEGRKKKKKKRIQYQKKYQCHEIKKGETKWKEEKEEENEENNT